MKMGLVKAGKNLTSASKSVRITLVEEFLSRVVVVVSRTYFDSHCLFHVKDGALLAN